MARYKKRSDGLYQRQITVTIDGKKKQKCFYAKTIPELNQKILNYQKEQEYVDNRIKFSTVADEWWGEHQKTLSPNSLHGYEKALEEAKFEFGEMIIEQISAMEINNYLLKLKAKKFGYKTICTRFQIIRQVFAYAVLFGYAPINVVLSVSIPRGLSQKRREMASDEDINRIKESDSLMAKLALYTGCRRGELLALRYEDIDRQEKTISISKSVYFESNQPHIKEPKTKAGVRMIPLLEPLEKILPKRKTGYILNQNGKMLTYTAMRYLWEKECKRLGISCGLHQLRHAYATRLYDLEIDVKSAQQIMGHADIATTQKIYTHLSEERKQQAFEKLKNF